MTLTDVQGSPGLSKSMLSRACKSPPRKAPDDSGTVPGYFMGRCAAALAIFAALLASTTPSPLYPVYIDRWGLPQSTATAIFSIYAAGTLAALFLSGWLNSRVRDRRLVLLPALAVTALGAVLFALADGVMLLFVGRFLSGVSTGLITGTASAAIFDLSRPERRSRAAVISTVAFTGGAAAGPCLSSAAIAADLAPLVSPFLAIAAIAAIAAAGLAAAAWPQAGTALAAAAGERVERFADRIGEALRGRLFLISCLAIITAWMLGSILMALGVSIATDLFDLHIAAVAGLMPALFQLFGGIGQVAASRVRPTTAIIAGFAAMALLLAGTAAGALATIPAIFILAMPLTGLAYGAAFVGGAALVNETSPEGTLAGRISRFYVAGYLANALPTMAMGVLIDKAGLEPAFLVFCAVLICLSIGGGALTLRRRRDIDRVIAS